MGIGFKASVVVAGGSLCLADLLLRRHGSGIPLVLFALGSAALVVRAVRAHRPANPLPWYCLAASIVLASGGIAIQSATGRSALNLPAASHAFIVVSMAGSIVAFALFVRARTLVLDRYQLLDLGIVVVSASLAISKLVLAPSMDAHPPVGISRGLSTAYILMILVTLVLAARFVTLPGRRGRSAWCLTAVAVGMVVASIVSNATATADGGGLRMAWTVMAASALTVMAAQHPSMTDMTKPATGEPPTFGVVRLGGLGLALFLTPLTAVLVHAQTDRAEALSILVPGAIVTALVMGRLRLLFAQERTSRDEIDAHREAFSALVHGISDVITVVDPGGTIAYVSQSAAKALQRPPDDLVGTLLSDLVHPDDAADLGPLVADLTGTGRTVNRTVRLTVGGDVRVFELEASDHSDNASLRGLIVVLHDVTDRHVLEDELRHQAHHDALTGLPNRKLFAERVRAAVAGGDDTSVLFIDLDDFKNVNDGLGHHVGDLLLCSVANRLLAACRDGDTVARLGGDEFAILVVDHHEQGTPQRVARRVLEVLDRPFEVGGHRISIGASIGVATGTDQTDEELLRHADVAMYGAKAAGKGTLALFEPGMAEAATDRLALHVDLAEGLTRDEFHLLYQPIFELATGQLRGGEALVRWDHPLLGLLLPDRFIGLAEDTGLIVPLGRWVLQEACRQAGEWPDEVGIAVNLSARQLEDPGLIDDVAATLVASGLRPGRLVLEVTESAVVCDREATIQRLSALRELGVRIAIDDFGTGYSSLSTLLELPVDVLKIDQSFVTTMLERSEASSLVKIVVEMGQTLEMEVVAEGIEDLEQAAALQAHSCQHGQGFLFSRPVDAAGFARFIGSPARSATQRLPVAP